MTRCFRIPTPLGEMIALAEQESLCGLWFAGQKHAPEPAEEWLYAADCPLFTRVSSQLGAYFRGKLRTFDLHLAPRGTPFRMAVWEALGRIPYGASVTYGGLAKELAGERDHLPSARAVGGAVGRNPLAIIIPCHRVIGADGSLTGYAGGLERKRALLALEIIR